MNLSRHLVYLEAQGVTPLALRMPVDGALPSVAWPIPAIATEDAFASPETHTVDNPSLVSEAIAAVTKIASVATELRHDLTRPDDAQHTAGKILPDATTQVSKAESPAVSFNFAIATAGALVLIDEIRPKADRRQQQQLLNNIAQALYAANIAVQFIDLNWPLKDHRALDHSDKGAFSFIQTWAESLTTRQHARFVVLFGETAKHWFFQALDELHLPSVVVPGTTEILEQGEKKAECWRLIRAYQALVSAAPNSSATHFE